MLAPGIPHDDLCFGTAVAYLARHAAGTALSATTPTRIIDLFGSLHKRISVHGVFLCSLKFRINCYTQSWS